MNVTLSGVDASAAPDAAGDRDNGRQAQGTGRDQFRADDVLQEPAQRPRAEQPQRQPSIWEQDQTREREEAERRDRQRRQEQAQQEAPQTQTQRVYAEQARIADDIRREFHKFGSMEQTAFRDVFVSKDPTPLDGGKKWRVDYTPDSFVTVQKGALTMRGGDGVEDSVRYAAKAWGGQYCELTGGDKEARAKIKAAAQRLVDAGEIESGFKIKGLGTFKRSKKADARLNAGAEAQAAMVQASTTTGEPAPVRPVRAGAPIDRTAEPVVA